MELGNLVSIGLAISQIVNDEKFNPGIAIVGFIILITTYFAAILLMKRGGKKK